MPVFGAHWLIGHYAATKADEHLEHQAILASEGVDTQLRNLTEELARLADAAGVGCGSTDIERMRTLALQSPDISILAMQSLDGELICMEPDLGEGAFQLFREPTPIFDGDFRLAQARIFETRITGLILDFASDHGIHSAFLPRQTLPHFFDMVDLTTGVALSLGDAVLFARDPETYGGQERAHIEVKSLPLVDGAMRVQVSVDRNLIEANFNAIRLWAMVGSIVIGALIVLLTTRLIHYTPAQVNEIERAINHDEFVPFYQPVIDVETGKLVGCEVLVRWIKPDGSTVSPGAFIGLAEQTGLAIPMTRRLMQAVVRDLQRDYKSRPGLKVAINLFNQHFTNLDIIEDVESIFGPSNIAYGQVVLEITERAPLESLSQAKVIMRKLQRLGCRLALDDAGTGHGGLAYLQELGLDIVKIDKMFIDQLGVSRIGESITHTLTDLAEQLDMDVVAEGVERIEQVAHLKRYGIRQAQGYLFAPALPAKQYLALVKKLGVADTQKRKSDRSVEAKRKAATIRAAARQIEEAKADIDADAA
ncbi:MAG: EAL domain-containing protein [Rhizobiales bacterium]|nr:EAL domain-containing protein [Hyphomicrobiales bacterium]MBO6698452.1 EAL domain-containing protein [Hyphomicrobiales bacterium]MBO6735294.1 EAL domain-containing protein [Hyphomicrobiales bacterium]MBO6910898.1 EAL domain-containing protein [Hyphomicrobiales bacterium]MBO6955954.1 EAL domain-containing protein [Hyphomicrobiales bacterium]